MSQSAWGVEHGAEVSKKTEKEYVRQQQLLGAVGGYGFAGAAHSSKKGRKLRNAGRSFGRELAEGTGGAVGGGLAGGLIGAGTRRPALGAKIGANVGAYTGYAHGAGAAARNAHRRGDIK